MNIIKEFCPAAKTCIIRANTYINDFAFIKSLVDEGKKDFPHLKNEEIRIIAFGGKRYKYTFGIGFVISSDIVPEGYSQISELEKTY